MAELMFNSADEILLGSNRINHFMDNYRRSYPRLNLNSSYPISVIRSVITYLNEENISYWVTNGTLLGLVRDGKFLDWDDDFDLDMDLICMRQNMTKIINFCLSQGYIIKVKKNGLFMVINVFSKNVKISLGGDLFLRSNIYTYSYKYPVNYIEPIREHHTNSDLDLKFPSEPEKLCDYIYVNWTYEIISESENDFINQKIRNSTIVKRFFQLLRVLTEPYSYWFLFCLKKRVHKSISS